MTVVVCLQMWMIWTGFGSNGKSLLLKILKRLLGQYYASGTVDVFFQSKRCEEGPAPQLTRLAGARLVGRDEAKTGAALNEAFIKEVYLVLFCFFLPYK